MIPALADILGRGQPQAPLAPAHFRPAGPVTFASRALGWNPSVGGRAPRRAVYKAGLIYEAQVKRWLKESRPNVELGPWFKFRSGLSPAARYCQPDAIEMVADTLHIYEIKLHWCPEAWWQLFSLYSPVLLASFGRRPIVRVAICRSFDPSVATPSPPARTIQSLSESELEACNVLIWKP